MLEKLRSLRDDVCGRKPLTFVSKLLELVIALEVDRDVLLFVLLFSHRARLVNRGVCGVHGVSLSNERGQRKLGTNDGREQATGIRKAKNNGSPRGVVM